MTYLIAALIVGINIAPFIFPQLDIWHAQGIFTQACILVLFSVTLLKSPRYIEPRNIPLGLLHLWVGLQTAFICFLAQTHGKYDITHFFPYFNFLCLIILYKFIVQYLNRQSVEFCMIFLRYSMVATLVLSGLQFMGLAQFFQVFGKSNGVLASPVVGFIGNGTHLSGFLAMMIPVFLYSGKREDWLCLTLTALLLCLSGTLVNDPAISGWIVGGFVMSCWGIYMNKIKLWMVFAGVSFVGLAIFMIYPQFFSMNGRTGYWINYLPLIKDWFVTGAGLGTLNAIYKDSAMPHLRHLHMEYLQFILEIGIIGVILGFNMIKNLWQTQVKDNLMFHVKLIFIAFCLSCCFNYPAHLWLPATYACIAYAFFMVLKRGEKCP